MAQSKQIQIDKWIEYCGLFSNGNRGRLLNIIAMDLKSGYQVVAEGLPLMALDYDPIKKGDDMIVSLGRDSLEFSHTIMAPVELWEYHNEKGVVTSVEIIDQNNNKLILLFN